MITSIVLVSNTHASFVLTTSCSAGVCNFIKKLDWLHQQTCEGITSIRTYACLHQELPRTLHLSVTKAVHLEVVSDLSTEVFIVTLRRFVSKRGCPSTIMSNNGTNFVGANNTLRELRLFLQSTPAQDKYVGTAYNEIWPGSPYLQLCHILEAYGKQMSSPSSLSWSVSLTIKSIHTKNSRRYFAR